LSFEFSKFKIQNSKFKTQNYPMRPLSAQQILRIWEIGQGQHPLDRALTMLSFACPDHRPEDLAALSIGQRDAALLDLRRLTLGAQLNGFAACPQCGEKLEFQVDAADLQLNDPNQPPAPDYGLTLDAFELRFRLPNSWDLAAIVGTDRAIADTQLLQRCLLQANQNGVPVPYAELPVAVMNQLAEQVVERDPQAELLLNLSCPACQHEWPALFDILAFFWAELAVQAQRLLREVHTLARMYGWREADILGMSAVRRQQYLDMVTDG
jgi:hypothetical protein